MKKQIKTPCGEILGCECSLPGVVAFKGIRYATAGRWEYPRQVVSWDGVYDATEYRACSYQPRAFYDEEKNKKKYFYYNEFRKGEKYTYDEDCLFLNIWKPDEADENSGLPVIVYIHGGGFTGGCGHEKHFTDPIWPTKGVVAVTLNYRLGPMGFLCLPELKAEAGHTGNYGLYDQLTALKWVRDNISAFGGDPRKVTLMGQSAGAISVQIHSMSRLSDGIFHRAVMSSGCGMSDMMLTDPEKVYPFWSEVMNMLGCKSLEEFRRVSPKSLFETWQKAKKEVKGGMMSTAPVKDGHLIVRGADVKQIPYVIGSNSQDMAPPILFSMAKSWGRKNSRRTYVYHFDRMLPGDKNGAWHSSDLWYWFGTFDNCWRPMEEKDRLLSDKMTTYLCNFAKNGEPNGQGNVAWSPCEENRTVMRFGEKSLHMGNPSIMRLIGIMLTNKAVGE